MRARIGEKGELIGKAGAGEQARNDTTAKIDWQFSTADACIRLRRLYPELCCNGAIDASLRSA